MRTTQPLCWNKWMRNGRRPARPPLRFTECKKLELKDYVSGGDNRSAELACNSQMLDMLNCLKVFDFDETKCSKQITSFRSCYQKFLESRIKSDSIDSKNDQIIGKRSQSLSRTQVNSLLKRYPQPN
ncbi:hypothetical protein SSS_08265 [Sarcoptes scabiei]|uniref:CHCH domain containing protein 2 n=1 Tax=Sarcoptes scabiei TaxID=52283 RepID=A0A132AJR9_SARSC|nr:hypothetical protein SSS_08265 [Sarcoptes scabiei]KPM11167.1 CHCH domain containing protein 2 [Sarcoptes scabiei]UXI15076.1 PHD finger protein 10 [Sarcoptes scabiei]